MAGAPPPPGAGAERPLCPLGESCLASHAAFAAASAFMCTKERFAALCATELVRKPAGQPSIDTCGVDACVVTAKPIRAPEEAALTITIIMLTTRNTHTTVSPVWCGASNRWEGGEHSGAKLNLSTDLENLWVSARRGYRAAARGQGRSFVRAFAKLAASCLERGRAWAAF